MNQSLFKTFLLPLLLVVIGIDLANSQKATNQNSEQQPEGVTESNTEEKRKLTEEEVITQVIENAKLLAAKRNTALIGGKASLQGIRLALKTNYKVVALKLKSGEIVDLGTYPNPRRVNDATVSWKTPEVTNTTQPTNTTNTSNPANPANPAN